MNAVVQIKGATKIEPMGLQPVSAIELARKYLRGEEKTVEDQRQRVGHALAKAENRAEQEKWGKAFVRALETFIPGGRINSNAGLNMSATLINCFVQPVGDSVQGIDHNGLPGIYEALRESAETLRRGGGVGYNFSAIRPKGAWVKGTNSRASGPVSYMDVFDASCKTVESAGARRGAQMGILNVSHPDIMEFVHSKDDGDRLKHFNISVGVTAGFMEAMLADGDWDLVHEAQPHPEEFPDAKQREDGAWVYYTFKARAIWDSILESTYDHADPGIIFLDVINARNALWYCERIEATNPCAEQPLPSYGCCDLGSVNLTRYVKNPFTPEAEFDTKAMQSAAATGVRMLDNVLDLTPWPLEAQQKESQDKRRIGVGFLGLGSALSMLGIRYGGKEAVAFTAHLTKDLAIACYNASSDLAAERGSFPLFDAEKHLQGDLAKRLPEDLREKIRTQGLRNSHVMSIAPTGTIALTFGDNASNGIEPPFALSYQRKIIQDDGTRKTVDVEDYAFRLWKHLGNDPENLPESFVTAQDITVDEHLDMMAAVQPWVDAAVSKTVNVPEDYPFEEFRKVYERAWQIGLKSVATFRPNMKTGSVLIVTPEKPALAEVVDQRGVALQFSSTRALDSMRWMRRPFEAAGHESRVFMVNDCPAGKFGVAVSHHMNGSAHPFEVWVLGETAPRGLSALAKVLSFDMRSGDAGWLHRKLDMLSRTAGVPFSLTLPTGESVPVPSAPAALARVLLSHCESLGYFKQGGQQEIVKMALPGEPDVSVLGESTWSFHADNHVTHDRVLVTLREGKTQDGKTLPFSVWLSGRYPSEWDGLCRALSLDMRTGDPAWVMAKLESLHDMHEPRGEFMARIPNGRQGVAPSTLAYIAMLISHRYRELGYEARPKEGVVATTAAASPAVGASTTDTSVVYSGVQCGSCGISAVIRRDGCSHCTACGDIGDCG